MSKNININSSEWCDFIFKNRNKAYGAYKMRQSSFKDHIAAFGITVLSLLIMIWVVPAPKGEANIGGGRGLSLESEIQLPFLPAPPKMHADFITFYEPEITPDNKIRKVVGDDKNGVLYEACKPITISISSIDCYFDDFTEYPIPLTPYCPTDPPYYPTDSIGCGYPLADVYPSYPGGKDELYKYLEKNLKYPFITLEMGVQGKVIIGFTVSKTGAISNPKIVKGLDFYCDKEAMRLIKQMPKWIPGKQYGRPVNVNYVLPIQFRLI